MIEQKKNILSLFPFLPLSPSPPPGKTGASCAAAPQSRPRSRPKTRPPRRLGFRRAAPFGGGATRTTGGTGTRFRRGTAWRTFGSTSAGGPAPFAFGGWRAEEEGGERGLVCVAPSTTRARARSSHPPLSGGPFHPSSVRGGGGGWGANTREKHALGGDAPSSLLSPPWPGWRRACPWRRVVGRE